MESSTEEASSGFTIWHEDEVVPPALQDAIVVLGNFDGVHRGHRQLIDVASGQARSSGRKAVALTFEPHPRSFFAPDKPLFRLTPEPVKLALLERFGLDGALVRRFDASLAETEATAFVRSLATRFGAAGVVVGRDFHFGRARQGTPALLEEMCRGLGLGCLVLPIVEEAGDPVSSSSIRQALAAGEVRRANSRLGYRWFVRGEVIHGAKRGRELGYPTANVALDPDCGLAHGIYAVRMALRGADHQILGGVASFGRRPTFDNGPPLLEVYLFDFSGDLYGREVDVEFLDFIRGEAKFDSAEALVARMDLDSQEARRAIAQAEGGEILSVI